MRLQKEWRGQRTLTNYPFREGHRRRNIRPPAATDRALRGAPGKGPPRARLLPVLSPEMSTLNFWHEIHHPKCPSDPFFMVCGDNITDCLFLAGDLDNLVQGRPTRGACPFYRRRVIERRLMEAVPCLSSSSHPFVLPYE